MQIENKTAEKTLDKVFRAYDVRGKYPDDIDESLAYKIGAAFCDYISGKRFVVGADMRLSSPSLAEAVLAAMKTKGVHVSYMGLTTTPRFYYAYIGYPGRYQRVQNLRTRCRAFKRGQGPFGD